MPGTVARGNKSQVLCEFVGSVDGKPLWYEPRQILKKVVQRFDKLGIKPVLAVELEFYLLAAERGADGAPAAAVSPRTGLGESSGKVLSLDKLDEFDAVLGAIENACRQQGVPTTSMISEYGAGQFEVNLAHQDDPIRAADHAALLRRAVTGVSRAQGYDASFMSKPFADQSGSGMHIHLSLVDGNGSNLLDPAATDADARLAQAIGGLQATMAESMAIFAPNLNVYRRFKPDEFVPVTTDWGENNRSVAFRIPPSDPANRRIEHRVSGAEANPYLVIAAVLAGVHHGLKNKIDPGKMVEQGAEIVPKLKIPHRWEAAIDKFERSKVLPEYLGADYCRYYAINRRYEAEQFNNKVSQLDFDWYLRAV